MISTSNECTMTEWKGKSVSRLAISKRFVYLSLGFTCSFSFSICNQIMREICCTLSLGGTPPGMNKSEKVIGRLPERFLPIISYGETHNEVRLQTAAPPQ